MVKRSAIGGVLISLAVIAFGLYLDGGKIAQMLQPTAALIVLGGTLGAVVVQFPLPIVVRSARQLKTVFFGADDVMSQRINDISRFAAQARRSGVVSLDHEMESVEDPFLRLCIGLIVDGVKSDPLRAIAGTAMESEATRDALSSRVYDAAGGFAPTVGILGAVIGLIQVMQRMQNISEVGQGIAVAFVATLYGVGVANLFFLPCAGRIKLINAKRQLVREMTLEGAACIAEGLNPRAVEQRLMAFTETPTRSFDNTWTVR
ncbi:flagellar motor protein [Granulicella sp. 5B5]|uniref:flagellar motor protein n=1 Tax=Granulicella sp. 5B5 TaxID=1617967 RepID=UPI0015F3C7B0|nr:flagellar motor protein [Granulicella sp. 5B5]QMV17500.1 flagellar motor protein [Granulicella sp. 5B5]